MVLSGFIFVNVGEDEKDDHGNVIIQHSDDHDGDDEMNRMFETREDYDSECISLS